MLVSTQPWSRQEGRAEADEDRVTNGSDRCYCTYIPDKWRQGVVPRSFRDVITDIPIRWCQIHGVRLGGIGKLRVCLAYRGQKLKSQILIPTPDKRTPGRFFVAGAFSGMSPHT